jgi:hypothetical protein
VVAASNALTGIGASLEAVWRHQADKISWTIGVLLALALGALNARLAADGEFTRISRVAVLADARGAMVVRNTEGVGAALQFGAAVHTLPPSLAQLEANLVEGAVQIVSALAGWLAALLRVSRGALRAQAFASVADCVCSASDALAKVFASAFVALESGRARSVRAARASGSIGALSSVRRQTQLEWVSSKAVLASAVKVSDGVDANGIAAASISQALVNVGASDVRISSEASRAVALHSTNGLSALGSLSTS